MRPWLRHVLRGRQEMGIISQGQQKLAVSVIGGSNIQRSYAFSNEQAVNCYPLVDPTSQETIQTRYAGSLLRYTFDIGGSSYTGRAGGSIALETEALVIIGSEVFIIDTIFAATNVGSITTTLGDVSIAIGGKYALIVDGTGGWTYDFDLGIFAAVTDINFPTNPTYVTELYGKFLVNNSGTQELYQSATYDPTKWDQLLRVQVNYRSSYFSYPLIAQASINGRLFAFTSGFIQVYDFSGQAGFAFSIDRNLVFGYGILNATSLAVGVSGGTNQEQPEFAIFLSKTPDGTLKFMLTSGNPPRVISTPSIDQRIESLTAPEECIAYIWTENGQTFYQASWTTDNLTLVYNVTNKVWFDVTYNNNRHFGESFCNFAGNKLITSYLDNSWYLLSENYLSNNGIPFAITRVTPNMRYEGYSNITGCYLEIWFEQGVGLSGAIEPDSPHYIYGALPECYLYISYDGGQTYENPLISQLGRQGRTYYTTRFMGLGTSKQWTFKIVVTAPVNVYIIGAYLSYTIAPGSG